MNEMTYAKVIEIADAYCDNEMPLAWKLNILYNFELELMGGVMLLSQTELDLAAEPTADTAATLTLPQKRPTTTRSAALNSSCKRLVRIMGTV